MKQSRLFDCGDAKLVLTPIGRSRIDAGGPLTQPESPRPVHARDGVGRTRKNRGLSSRVSGRAVLVASGRWPSGTPLLLATALLPGASLVASGSSGDQRQQPTPALSRWLPMFGTLAS